MYSTNNCREKSNIKNVTLILKYLCHNFHFHNSKIPIGKTNKIKKKVIIFLFIEFSETIELFISLFILSIIIKYHFCPLKNKP
jgi:hypothetical protein